MLFHVLACDYDGTLALDSMLSDATAEALERVKRSGRKLVMVTGRELPDLQRVCDKLDLFDLIVAENGALLYIPATREERLLCEPADLRLAEELRRAGASPLSVGRGIIATWEPFGTTTLEAIRMLGLEHVVVFNKGAVMVLPPNVNKGSGLLAGLRELGCSRHNTVGMGDAENDHAFLSICECGVAVANALPAVKERADYVTAGDHGAGVIEMIDEHLLLDLTDLAPRLAMRHHILLGRTADGTEIGIPAQRAAVFVTGASGAGKTTISGLMIERLIADERSVVVIDPEGDYSGLADIETVVVFGGRNDKPLPSQEELGQLIRTPETNIVLDLHALSMAEKTKYVAATLGTFEATRARHGKPHWVVFDEAHHMMPREGSSVCDSFEVTPDGLCLITFDASLVCPQACRQVRHLLARTPEELRIAVEAVLGSRGETLSREHDAALRELVLEENEAALVRIGDGGGLEIIRFIPDERQTTHQRHVRKYVVGELADEESFYFRGPEGKLNLRAANLLRFSELAEGVDDETWHYHLREGDISAWMREAINDEELADEIAAVERHAVPENAGETRREVLEAVRQRYAV